MRALAARVGGAAVEGQLDRADRLTGMSQQAGWYDDPEQPDQLRYWDGVQWTDHIAPRQKPNLDRAGQTADAQAGDGSATGQQGASREGRPQGTQDTPGAQESQWNSPWAGQSMPGAYDSPAGATTPDGAPLAGWWHRVAARLIDGILAFMLTAVLGALTQTPELAAAVDEWWRSGSGSAGLPVVIQDWAVRVGLIAGVIGIAYEVLMVKFLGGTLGKLATGLRVRMRDEPGLPTWGATVVRSLVLQGPNLLSNLSPALGVLSFFTLLDVLWPLWDRNRQAIHDKVARTNVVRTR